MRSYALLRTLRYSSGCTPMTSADSAAGASVGEWNAIVRRARIGPKRKLACLLMSSYADPDGTSIYCGVARLAADLECGYRTAQRYLEWMRTAGLIELVAVANRRKGLNDEYRLVLTPTLFDKIDLSDPEEYKSAVGTLAERNRARQKAAMAKHSIPDQTSPRMTSDPGSDGTPIGGRSDVTQDDVWSGDQTSKSHRSDVTQDDVHTSHTYTSPVSLTSHDQVTVRTELALSRARGRKDQIFSNDKHLSEPPTPPTATLRNLVTPQPEPTRSACPTGLGFCITCYGAGATTLAADPVTGSYCAHHTREHATP